MKTAHVQIEVISLACPTCGRVVTAPNGAENLTEIEFQALPPTIKCDCGTKFRKPKVGRWSAPSKGGKR